MKRSYTVAWLLALAVVANAQLHGQTAPVAETAEHKHAPAKPSTGLTLTVDGKSTTLPLTELQALPQRTITVHNEHTKADEIYSGVALGELLARSGFPVDSTTHRKMLRSYLIAEGTDKYWVLYSVTEIEASEHKADVIIATTRNGKPLGEDGALKLIDSGDQKPERWVRNLTAITIKSGVSSDEP